MCVCVCVYVCGVCVCICAIESILSLVKMYRCHNVSFSTADPQSLIHNTRWSALRENGAFKSSGQTLIYLWSGVT